ncbi:MAG TPA: DUF1570 domain-containing protein [Planctomycetota bacterium]|nr:DUF1570 domain-containing protein [Planctomycetota bacterium]
MKALLALLAAATLFGAVPQDPPPADEDPKEKKERIREEEAASILEKAKAFFTEGKFQEALDQLKMLRARYFSTRAFGGNAEEVDTMITDCGFKVAASGLASIKINKKSAHIDTLLGFQFNPPEGWRGIPNWQKFFGEADTSEADWRGQSYRVTRYTSRWLESLHLKAYKTYAPNNIEEIIDGEEKTWTQSPFEGMEVVATDDFKGGVHIGRRVQKKDPEGNRMVIYAFLENKKGFALVGYWRTSENEFVWVRRADEKKKRGPSDEEWSAALKVFDQVAKTFQIMNQQTLSQMRIAMKPMGISPDGWCVKCVDWGVHQTEKYTIEYQTKKEFAEKLGKELEQIYRLYQVAIPSAKTNQRCRVKLFDCQEDFQYYGQAPGAAAYWSPAQEEIVAYRFEGGKVVLDSKEEMTVTEERTPEQTTFSILYHECFHQYMYYLMGRRRQVYVPSWLNEGMGDYFFGGRWEKGKFAIGPNEWRMATIVAAVKKGKHVPLEKIFRYTQEEYYSNAHLCYAQGWAINYFFMSDVGKKSGYHMIPPKMFDNLTKSGDWKKATDSAFAGYDVKKMEEEWKTFVLGLEKLLPKGALEKEGDVDEKKD